MIIKSLGLSDKQSQEILDNQKKLTGDGKETKDELVGANDNQISGIIP